MYSFVCLTRRFRNTFHVDNDLRHIFICMHIYRCIILLIDRTVIQATWFSSRKNTVTWSVTKIVGLYRCREQMFYHRQIFSQWMASVGRSRHSRHSGFVMNGWLELLKWLTSAAGAPSYCAILGSFVLVDWVICSDDIYFVLANE